MADHNHNKFRISVWDLMILVYNYANNKALADLSIDKTFKEVCYESTQMYFELPLTLYQELLYCSNIADEEQRFWHPERKDFEVFVKLLLRSSYDRKYGLIKRKGE